MSHSDQKNERRIMLVNRRTGEEVLLATVSEDGRNVDVPNSIERPLVVAIREMCLYSQEGDIVMTGEKAGQEYAELAAGVLDGIASTIDRLKQHRGIDQSSLDTATSALQAEATGILERSRNA